MGVGSTNQLELGRSDIAALSLIEPSSTIRKEFHNHVWPIFDQIETLAHANRLLASARDELLPKLMSGAIQV
jgi:restriction endonuclease S subunit